MWLSLLLAVAATAAPALPAFAVTDPRGRLVTDVELKQRGAVLVVTTPTISQGPAQRGWNEAFGRHPWPSDGPFFGFVEDLSQSWFAGIAQREISSQYDPPPVFLVESSGALRAGLGVEAGTTAVVLIAPGGEIVAIEKGAPTAGRAEALWRRASSWAALRAAR